MIKITKIGCGHKIHTIKFYVESIINFQQFVDFDHFEKMVHDENDAMSMVKKREKKGHLHGKKKFFSKIFFNSNTFKHIYFRLSGLKFEHDQFFTKCHF